MRAWILVVTAVVVAAAMVSGADDECGPPPAGQRKAHPGQCCTAGQAIAARMKESGMKCMQKYPRPARPQGPPPTGTPPTPSPEMEARHACMEECVYTEAGVMTSDKQLDKNAITKLYANSSDAATIKAAVDKCFATYKTGVDQTMECKSGASKFNKCVHREVFLNCPADKWTSSTDCDDLKARVAKCPDMPFHGHGGGGGGGMHMRRQ